jgi:hypothetical protein
MDDKKDRPKHLAILGIGAALGAFLLNAHNEESKKSAAERDDPDGVRDICIEVGDFLDDWAPRGYNTDDEYTDDLAEYLHDCLSEGAEDDSDEDDDEDGDEDEDDEDDEGEDDDEEERVLCRPTTAHGIPDILIDQHGGGGHYGQHGGGHDG